MSTPKPEYSVFKPEWKDLFDRLGLNLLGMTVPDYEKQELLKYKQWISQGRGGGMTYLENHQDLKFSPQTLLEGCKSILFTSLDYYQEVSPGDLSPLKGRIARYAWGRDYHKTLGNRLKKITAELKLLFPQEAFRSFTDSGPLAERWYAQNAGLGFIGRHTLLIDPKKGSWFLLGEILTTLDPTTWGESSAQSPQVSPKVHGGACPSGCKRCLNVCPTEALESSGLMDARKCISYLTIEHKGSLPVELRDKMGNWIFGCDLCQEVCPFNLRAQATGERDFLTLRAGSSRDLRELLALREEEFITTYAGTPLMRTGRISLIRNACVAAGNSLDPLLVPPLEILAEGDDTLLREHALWALAKIRSRC